MGTWKFSITFENEKIEENITFLIDRICEKSYFIEVGINVVILKICVDIG